MINLKIGVTERGFPRIEFQDLYNVACSLQLSSLAEQRAIWFGVDNPHPRVLGEGGWTNVELPEGAVIASRMHLSRDQAKALMKYLHAFVETGDILGKPQPVSPGGQQLYAEIKKSSKYASQADWAKREGRPYPFPVRIASDGGGDYVVKGGVGGQYRLADVNLFVIENGQKFRVR
ncbi:hypothetical protein [Stutzerimonas nitrititolerans]|uniref:hypothetical protein n=1 Tax=Stutzerimonas nitrititolerans TaxID=2482751 RepID=UPI00289CBDAC|nr:hypothetical protein [Stutzerimonas nitrititolerans]